MLEEPRSRCVSPAGVSPMKMLPKDLLPLFERAGPAACRNNDLNLYGLSISRVLIFHGQSWYVLLQMAVNPFGRSGLEHIRTINLKSTFWTFTQKRWFPSPSKS